MHPFYYIQFEHRQTVLPNSSFIIKYDNACVLIILLTVPPFVFILSGGNYSTFRPIRFRVFIFFINSCTNSWISRRWTRFICYYHIIIIFLIQKSYIDWICYFESLYSIIIVSWIPWILYQLTSGDA